MASGKTWSLVWIKGVYEEFAFRINLEEIYSIESNKSIITISSMQFKADEAFSEIHYPNGQILIGGKVALVMNSNLGTHNVRAKQADVWYDIKESGGAIATGSVEIEHDNDGSKTVFVELLGRDGETRFYFNTPSGNGSCIFYNPEVKSITLTPIPRASTIGATDADIGSRSAVVVTQRSVAYTHSIQYVFRNLSGYINSDGSISDSEVVLSATNIAFLVPETFYAEIPDAPYDSCTLICTTYYNGVQIGDAQSTTFKATASAITSAPVVTGTVEDINEKTVALTGNASVLVRYCSNALCTIDATPRNSATIVAKYIGGHLVEEDTFTFVGVESGSVEFTAVDSRGYTTTILIEKEFIEYVKLTSNVRLVRKDATSGNATLSVSGLCFNGSFGSVDNSITATYSVARSGSAFETFHNIELSLDGNSYTGTVDLSGLHYEYSYNALVIVTDRIVEVEKVATVGKGIPVFDWGQLDFKFNVPVRIPDSMYGASLPEDAKAGQVFLLRNTDGSYSIRVYNGSSWS